MWGSRPWQAIERKKRSQMVQSARREARHQHVTMLRKYRSGEVHLLHFHF